MTASELRIRDAEPADAAACAAIYAPIVRNTPISFEFTEPDAEEFATRIARVQETDPWLVATLDDVVVGYAYAADFRARAAYAGSRETTVYVHEDHHGRGIGSALMRRLIADLRDRGAHVAVACIALPNDGSVALHEQLGFNAVGVFRESGRKFDTWHDVGFWELLL
ncbi:MAG: N-acetyltransferase family protein [Acidimicrobiales bacterium]|nr:N-acetyltransferase family protein [Acidimicrobiales bacterium]